MVTDRARTRARPLTDVVPELARRFLTAPEPPSRLPTIRDLAHEHGSSLASIHVAMGRLEEAGAIRIETRGRLGAFMVDRSVGRLWATAENGPLVIGLPLASSPRYEGLATAIKQLLTTAGLEVFLIFVRGSRQRLQAVREGRCHLTAMSSFAAAELCGPEDAIVVELAPDSYNTGHRVFYSAANRTRTRSGDRGPTLRGSQLLTAPRIHRDRRALAARHAGPDHPACWRTAGSDAAVWTGRSRWAWDAGRDLLDRFGPGP